MSTSPKRLGKYELQERQGRGGMGEVWKAFDTQLQRHVAIKLLHTDLQNDPSFVSRFQREAQVIASLHHSNIVQVYDFQVSQPPESENTIVYMVMDYVEGQTLAQYISSTSRVSRFPSAPDIVHLFTYISIAIDYAHSKGMIHRDVKPSNILLDKRQSSRNPMGEPVLTDFGIAKLLGSSSTTLSGWWFGTPLYTSPEQAKGSPGNERSDLYSLGVILYEVCTGVLPFQGDNAAAILMQHINATPTSPSLINPNISPALAMVILRSIAKEPGSRFPSAAAMTSALAEALNVPVPEVLTQSAQSNTSAREQNYQSSRPPLASPAMPPTSLLPQQMTPSAYPSFPTIPSTSGQGMLPVGYNSGDASPMRPNLNTPILPPFSSLQESQQYFMVQEYMGGENLEARLERLNHPLEEWEVLLYASQVLETLNDLARQTPPVVHGNIKPANIVVGTRDRKAHLIGFNAVLGDAAHNLQWKQTPASGTQGYVPLEQLQGQTDPRSDLYALAATMHYLLTNRNPRNNAPFSYPLVRALNPQLSAEVELLLVRALLNDITQRYQSAAEMKRDIDDMLRRRYGLSGDMANIAMGSSGVMPAVHVTGGSATPPPKSVGTRISGWLRPSVATGPATSSMGNPPPAAYSGPVQSLPPQRRPWTRSTFLIVALIILLIGGGLSYSLFALFHHSPSETTQTTPAVGIGIVKAPDGESIGLSDGRFAFDTNRPGGDLMRQAGAKLQAGDVGSAESLWQAAWQADTGNAEPLIYTENERVLASGSPYITLVVATLLDPTDASVLHGDLQGAYIAQKEYNAGLKLPGGRQVRLLIAEAGGTGTNAKIVAQQIVRAAQTDKTIVGVMGWPYSGFTSNGIAVLAAAHIPLVSQTASSGSLTGISPYFFRVNPPDSVQAAAAVKYTEQSLHAKTVALFMDPSNTYSNSLGTAFKQLFTADGNTIVDEEHYTVKKPASLPNELQKALTHNPDLIYFSGYADDANVLLINLPSSGKYVNLKVMGGDGLYVLSGYTKEGHAQLGRLRLTAFAYPDEWQAQNLQNPAFFGEYPSYFDPNKQPHTNPYGYDRPDSEVMLAYDATTALLHGSGIALAGGKQNFTPADLRNALATINGSNAFQGVSGQVAFGSDGNPINKAVVVLSVSSEGFFQIQSVQGKFLVGS